MRAREAQSDNELQLLRALRQALERYVAVRDGVLRNYTDDQHEADAWLVVRALLREVQQ